MAHKWHGYTAKVTATAKASNNHIRVITCQIHLFLSLQTNDRLVNHHMVQHTAKGIFCVRILNSLLHSLRYGHTKATSCARELLLHLTSYLSLIARRCKHCGTVCVHNGAAERLLLKTNLNHKHSKVKTKVLTSHTHGTTPLTCASLCGNVFCTLNLIKVRLRNGRVQFV